MCLIWLEYGIYKTPCFLFVFIPEMSCITIFYCWCAHCRRHLCSSLRIRDTDNTLSSRFLLHLFRRLSNTGKTIRLFCVKLVSICICMYIDTLGVCMYELYITILNIFYSPDFFPPIYFTVIFVWLVLLMEAFFSSL